MGNCARPAKDLVRVIDIDEESLGEIGQWPWSRAKVAELILKLHQMGAATVGLDIVFSEPDRLSPAILAEEMAGLDPKTRADLAQLPSNDAAFANIAAQTRTVLGHATRSVDADGFFDPVGPKKWSMISKSETGTGETLNQFLYGFISRLGNLPELEAEAPGLGMFALNPDGDGVVRRVDMLVRIGNDVYPTLTLEMLRVAFGQKGYVVKTNSAGLVSIALRNAGEIPVDEHGRAWVYYRPYSTDDYISARDVLNDEVDPAEIQGKFIVIGTSAVGLLDLRSTPVANIMAGVDVHAQLLENIIDGEFLKRPNYMVGLELGVLLLVGIALIILVPWVGAKWTLMLAIGAIGGVIGGSWWGYSELLILVDPAYPTVGILLLYTTLVYISHAREEAERRQVRNAFSHYMSPALVEQLAEDPSKLRLGGEMRDMTLLFCDVRGFTTISEQFDAEGLTGLINAFLTPMTDVILKRRGTIDKYMGDCIMAFWNAPLDDSDHARHACDSAITMAEDLAGLNDRLEIDAKENNRKHVPINIGIGLNTGECCVGNMGSDQRFDYSVLGDAVNLASRLEGQSKTYGVTTVIGAQTYRQALDFACLELDSIMVKGKTEPVTVFGLLGRPDMAQGEAFQSLKTAHDDMLTAYRAQNWDLAKQKSQQARAAAEAMGQSIGGLYTLYDGRIEAYEANPPGADWDGVFVATSK